MIKPLSVLAAVALFDAVLQVQAQETAVPLLRVYIEPPYFYDS